MFHGAFLHSALPCGVSRCVQRTLHCVQRTLHCHVVFNRFKCVLIDDVSYLTAKLSEVGLDFVTKIKSKHISFLQCMHGKETSTNEMRNCWAGDDAGYQNLRMIKSASEKPKADS